jgi:hypothetical protein
MSQLNSESHKAIQFVRVSGPKSRKHAWVHRSTIQSHAARTSHAKVRHARTIQYQAANAAKTTPQQIKRLGEDKLGIELAQADAANQQLEVATETRQGDVPGWQPVLCRMGSGRRDFFMSFVRPFKPIEHFLLDHCKYRSTRVCMMER